MGSGEGGVLCGAGSIRDGAVANAIIRVITLLIMTME